MDGNVRVVVLGTQPRVVMQATGSHVVQTADKITTIGETFAISFWKPHSCEAEPGGSSAMWVKLVVPVLALLLVGLGGAVVLGAHHWRITTRGFVSRLNASRQAPRPATYTAAELERLPAPVARYFRTVLRDGQPIVAVPRLVQDGEFRMGDADESWRPFGATQVCGPSSSSRSPRSSRPQGPRRRWPASPRGRTPLRDPRPE